MEVSTSFADSLIRPNLLVYSLPSIKFHQLPHTPTQFFRKGVNARLLTVPRVQSQTKTCNNNENHVNHN